MARPNTYETNFLHFEDYDNCMKEKHQFIMNELENLVNAILPHDTGRYRCFYAVEEKTNEEWLVLEKPNAKTEKDNTWICITADSKYAIVLDLMKKI